LTLAIDLLDQECPTQDDVLRWQLQLDTLAALIERASSNNESQVTISPGHSQRLADLGRTLAEASAKFEHHQLSLDSLLDETAASPLGESTLEDVLRDRQAAYEKATAERLAASRQAARAEAEKAQIERLSQLEKESIDADTKRKEEKMLAEAARKKRLHELELEQIAEETRVKEAQQKALVAGLLEEAKRLGDALAQAQLEREFERVRPEIEATLVAFTQHGYAHRQDGTKGPVSYAFISESGALVPGRAGLEKLMRLASVSNDRPRGGIPQYIGGDNGWAMTNTEAAERAQELLRRFGSVMVEKQMLAP
jgi:hypothetical protein